MNHNNNIYKELMPEIKKILSWGKTTKPWNENETFNFDQIFDEVLKKYNVSFDYGLLKPIYWLVDAYCDAKRHGFKNINENYSTAQAHFDLIKVVELIESGKPDGIEEDRQLMKRIEEVHN